MKVKSISMLIASFVSVIILLGLTFGWLFLISLGFEYGGGIGGVVMFMLPVLLIFWRVIYKGLLDRGYK